MSPSPNRSLARVTLLLAVLCHPRPASADGSPQAPSPPAKSSVTNLIVGSVGANLVNGILRQAEETRDQEVLEAGVYVVLHLKAAGPDPAEAAQAWASLAKSGDEFTLDWLRRIQKETTNTMQIERIDGATSAIEQRLKSSPPAPEKLVRPRLFRAALCDVTCNQLETSLVGFTFRWLAGQRSSDAVRAELRAARTEVQRSLSGPGQALAGLNPRSVRLRVQRYLEQLANAAPKP